MKNLTNKKVNLLIVGATGAGKSSTINALFEQNDYFRHKKANVGNSPSPETKMIDRYTIGNINIWDTPGLGDDTKQDIVFKQDITKLLQQKDNENLATIDMAIVIIDGNSKNIGTTIDIVNNVLIPNFGKESDTRILIAVNKIDLIKGGRYWDVHKNRPSSVLDDYLKKLTGDIRERILDFTGISITPIIYSAGDKTVNQAPYNLLVFINHVLKNMPNEKRLAIATTVNKNKNNWTNNKNSEKEEKFTRKLLRQVFRTAILTGISSFFGGLFTFDI